MNKPKEQAQADFIEMIKHSWTYCKMTPTERKTAIQALLCGDMLQGSYKQRYSALNAVYRAFLLGIGYDGATWREHKENDTPKF